jgi:hypothetical protein
MMEHMVEYFDKLLVLFTDLQYKHFMPLENPTRKSIAVTT